MKINVNYYPQWEDITVQTGWWNNGYFEMETCNHAGMYKTQENGWAMAGGEHIEFDDFFYKCDKCEETFNVWEIE